MGGRTGQGGYKRNADYARAATYDEATGNSAGTR